MIGLSFFCPRSWTPFFHRSSYFPVSPNLSTLILINTHMSVTHFLLSPLFQFLFVPVVYADLTTSNLLSLTRRSPDKLPFLCLPFPYLPNHDFAMRCNGSTQTLSSRLSGHSNILLQPLAQYIYSISIYSLYRVWQLSLVIVHILQRSFSLILTTSRREHRACD